MGEPSAYDLALLALGALALAGTVLPHMLEKRLLSYPIVVVLAGMALFAVPLTDAQHPLEAPAVTEHLSEFAVIVALTALGLKIDRPLGRRRWATTWRLLGITMPITIAAAAFLGWWGVGLAPAAALLFGAVLAPTDPVLSGDVQTGPPTTGDPDADEPDEVRFSLTSESALNDGLAFPFTNLAIAVAVAGLDPSEWFVRWLLVDVVYKIAVGLLLGWLIGRLLGSVVVRLEERGFEVRGLVALAMTLISYGAAELAAGYGFIAVFVTAYTVRHTERTHDIHDHLHEGADQLERLAMGAVLLALGGALMAGMLQPLTWRMVLVGLALVLVVRPLSGYLGLRGDARLRGDEKLVVSFFGIRGLGSIYYLAHGLNEAEFGQGEELWALLGFVLLLSLAGHGLTGRPVMKWLDQRRGTSRPTRPPETATEDTLGD